MFSCSPQPPLVQACFHGDAAEVRALISRKEEVNYQVSLNFLTFCCANAVFSTTEIFKSVALKFLSPVKVQ